MCHQKFTRTFIALASLQLLLSTTLARADYGVESRRPLSDPQKAKVDNRPVGTWRATLDGKQYLIGDRFTVADLNVASVLSWTQMAQLDLSSRPHLQAWLGRCLGRPAFGAQAA